MNRLFLVCLGLFSVGLSFPAAALNNRTWVSGHGVDQAGCGAVAAPCRTLQFAHDQTNVAGEIDVLDAAGYGPVVITKSISIINDGAGTAGITVTTAPAITINAKPADQILLRGLTMTGPYDGTFGFGSGTSGVLMNSGGFLLIDKCLIQRTEEGISVRPKADAPRVVVSNTVSSYNSGSGFYFAPANGSTATSWIDIDNLTASFNGGAGIGISDLPTSQTTAVRIANSKASGNSESIWLSGSSNINVKIDLCQFSNNRSDGVDNFGATVYIGRSEISGNTFGIFNAFGSVYSYGDNRTEGNKVAGLSGTIGVATLK